MHEPVGLFSITAILLTGTCSICSAKYTYGVDGCTISVLCSPCLGDSGTRDVVLVAAPSGCAVGKDDNYAVALGLVYRVSMQYSICHLQSEVGKSTSFGIKRIFRRLYIVITCLGVHVLESGCIMTLRAVSI